MLADLTGVLGEVPLPQGFDMNTVVLLGVAILNCLTAFFGYMNHRNIIKVTEDVRTIEKATNSMKDALVISTDKAARAEGMAAGRAAGEITGLQQGRDEVRVEVPPKV